MSFVTMTHKEQDLFTLLFIYHYNRTKKDKEKNVSKRTLLINIPDTEEPPKCISEDGLDSILKGFISTGYIEEELYGKESYYYQLTDKGEEYLKKDSLLIPSERKHDITHYLPRYELEKLLKTLSHALKVQISIMNENSAFWIGSPREGKECLCDNCIRQTSILSWGFLHIPRNYPFQKLFY